MYISSLLAAATVSLAALVSAGGGGAGDCKCGPTDPCWPSDRVWSAFNRTVNGRLIKTVPVGSVCHDKTIVDQATLRNYNGDQCANVKGNWNIPNVSSHPPPSADAKPAAVHDSLRCHANEDENSGTNCPPPL